ncbi:DUF4167 domain-containing protein [Candidatus Pelagibacter sp.]|uniref:DUF4167 domain-containing protein n=1 Tax=Candidatus Pelagibacter sp. TaxID=2024849 RepID=UPI003F874A99
MVTFRSNNSRRVKRNDRPFKNNGERKFGNNFASNNNFQRKSPGRNNHNAPKLIEKYINLAREALSTGDKILSENYFQHADHFTRILNEQENFRNKKYSNSNNKEDGFEDKNLEDNEKKDTSINDDTLEKVS